MELSDFGLDEKTMGEILTISSVEVVTDDTIQEWDTEAAREDRDYVGVPVEGGLKDPRLAEDFGHIALAAPVTPYETVRLQLPFKEIENLPVPPLSIRNTITDKKGFRSEHDLTHKLCDTIRINRIFRELKSNLSGKGAEGEYDDILDEMHALLEFHVSTYLDNQLDFWVSSKHRAGRPMRGVYQFCSPEDTTRDFMSWRPQKRKELQRLLERYR